MAEAAGATTSASAPCPLFPHAARAFALFVFVIVGVSRRNRVAHVGDETPVDRGEVLGDELMMRRILLREGRSR